MNHSLFDEPKKKNADTLLTVLGVMTLSAAVLVGELSFLPREHVNDYSPRAHANTQKMAYNG